MQTNRWQAKDTSPTVTVLVRIEQLSIHPGDHVEIRIDKRWAGGNRAQIVKLLPNGFRGKVCHEDRRAKFVTAPTQLGVFEVPYTAIKECIL